MQDIPASLPTSRKTCAEGAAGTGLPFVNVKSSQFLGDGHVEYGAINGTEKDYRILSWVEFDFDGQRIWNFSSGGDFGTTTRIVRMDGPQGDLFCFQEAVADRSFLPQSQQLSDRQFRLAVAGFDPLTPREGTSLDTLSQLLACGTLPPMLRAPCLVVIDSVPLTPAINGEVIATMESNGDLSFEYTTDFFPSYGIAVQINGGHWLDKVIHDASCVQARGYEGAAKLLVRLQTEAALERNSGVLGRGTADHVCEPVVYPELVSAAIPVLKAVLNPFTEPITFNLTSHLP